MVIGYGTIQWAGPIVSFFFTPIITRILTPSDYGIADYVLTVASGIGIVALFGVPQALMTHFNDYPRDEQWQRHVTGSALFLVILIGLPFAASLIFLAPQISDWSLRDERYAILFQLVGATLISSAGNTILMTAAQSALRVRWGMLFSLTTLAATVLGNIVFIIVLRLGVLGMILVPSASAIALSIVILIVTRGMIGAPQPAILGQLLRSGMLLLPAMASAWALQMVDRLFLVHVVSTQELGYYAIANKIAGLLYVLMAPVYSAWMPLALAMQAEPNATQRYADVARYLIAFVLFAALGLGLFATEILIVMTRAPYLPAAPYVGFLAYVHFISTIGTVLSTGAMAGKQLSAISWTVGASAMVNIILNFALIPSLGLWGATIATVIGYAVQPVLLYPLIQKRYPIPYRTVRLLSVILVQVGLMVVGTLLLPPMIFPIRITVKLAILAMLPLAYIALGVITRFELRQAAFFLRHRLQLASARIDK